MGNTEAPFGMLFLKTIESILEVVILSAGGKHDSNTPDIYVLRATRLCSRKTQKSYKGVSKDNIESQHELIYTMSGS